MTSSFDLPSLFRSHPNLKTYTTHNFGCRVNAAEINLLSQILQNLGLHSNPANPDLVLINTCAITKKGEYESLKKIRQTMQNYPNSLVIATGCANLQKLKFSDKLVILSNPAKESLISSNIACAYSKKIDDKFSRSRRYLLRVQSGCSQFCSYCIVPYKRPFLWSMSLKSAVSTVNSALKSGYREIIITGVNLDQYTPGLSKLVETLLKQTAAPLISFGSIPLNSIDSRLIRLYSQEIYSNRLSHFLHIPIQSASDKILKLMNRPCSRAKIIKTFTRLKSLPVKLTFGTDIIVGFPGETQADFDRTLAFCQQIGFKKIHTFRYSPRPGTAARQLFLKSQKLKKEAVKSRAKSLLFLSQL